MILSKEKGTREKDEGILQKKYLQLTGMIKLIEGIV